jgi:palmitoyltransferase ZDHHC2/15/20
MNAGALSNSFTRLTRALKSSHWRCGHLLGLPLVIVKSLIVYVIVYSMVNFHFATISSIIGTFATVLYYIPFLILTFLEFFAYFRCMLSDPGYCRYHTADSDDAGDNDNENAEDKGSELRVLRAVPSPVPPGAQICHKCNCVKIPRAHHCSLCQRCVMRMDHHCPWVNNCVGLKNHKFFIQFLVYASAACFMAFAPQAVMAGVSGFGFWTMTDRSLGDNMAAVFGFLFSGMFFFSLFGFAYFHIQMIANDDSTIELGRRSHGFVQRGRMENLRAILGPTYRSWLLPWAESLSYEDDFDAGGSSHAADINAQNAPESGEQLEEVKVQ